MAASEGQTGRSSEKVKALIGRFQRKVHSRSTGAGHFVWDRVARDMAGIKAEIAKSPYPRRSAL